jgi:hypothetical protein
LDSTGYYAVPYVVIISVLQFKIKKVNVLFFRTGGRVWAQVKRLNCDGLHGHGPGGDHQGPQHHPLPRQHQVLHPPNTPGRKLV